MEYVFRGQYHSIEPFTENDTETIPFSSKKDASGLAVNDKIIADFITKWVRDPSTVIATSIGSEINFNRVFPKTVYMRSTDQILIDIAGVDDELKALEGEFSQAFNGDRV